MGDLRLILEGEACPGRKTAWVTFFAALAAQFVIINNNIGLSVANLLTKIMIRPNFGIFTAMKWAANARHCGIKRERACCSVKSGGGTARTNLAKKTLDYNKNNKLKAIIV